MAGSFSEWVRNRSDDELLALLAARPDLGTPAPSTLRSLATRAASRTSLDRALGHLDAGTLQVLESLVALSDGGTPVRPEQVAAALGAPEAGTAVGRVLDGARAAALVWEEGDGVLPTPGLEDVLGPYPAGLGPVREGGRPATGELPSGAQPILDALAWGPPVGVVPPPGTAARRAVDALVEAGLLLRSDTRHVLLPRDVGLSLRGGRTHRTPDLDPPRPDGREVPATGADAEAATAALETVRQVARLVVAWDDAPPSVLRAGGLGVRDLRRTALLLESDEPTAAFVVELAASAGLVADDGDAPASYVPTVRADLWEDADDAERWATLVTAWTTSRRTPWQVGSRDEKGNLRAPLSPDLHRPWVARLRAQVLDVLAAQPGTALGPDEVMTVLRWRSPRTVPPAAALAGLLREAASLGVTGAGALSSPGHVLAASVLGSSTRPEPGDDAGTAVASALRDVLPAEVDEVLLQGDLTGIVPGRPSPALARLLDQAADIESRGAATTVRFSTGSVTRALDHGRSGAELLAELAGRSPVPVPQPLEYLVKDTARRHEAVRVGAATSYVRAADPTALAGLTEDPRLSGLGLVRLAPTVLAASVPAAELHDSLRRHGLLSGLEGPDGRPLGTARRTVRLDRTAWSRRSTPAPVRDASADARTALVAHLRGTAPGFAGSRTDPPTDGAVRNTVPDGGAPAPVDVTDGAGPPAAGAAVGHGAEEPGDAVALLHDALRDGRTVRVEMVGPAGALQRRDLKPLRLEGGRLRALDAVREAELTVAVHRIASVEPLD
ncbi:helicase-associated domain-containing protein [Isoptericola croceus]|uniref:helicase-associated domain-containing protein n=1 Tax=Isoptericola croceus TaxID=3031406 RepID=UPI0023F81E5B|nr:helicase-associated domain-containing protein [Isoptericola croceus]